MTRFLRQMVFVTSLTLSLITLLLTVTTLPLFAEEKGKRENHRAFEEVPFTDVHVTDQFWAPRIRTNETVSAIHNIDWCQNQTRRIDNFRVSAGLKEGGFEGIYFDDSDVYKVIEGLAYTLSEDPDPAIEKTTKEWIDIIAAAQQPDGYLMNYFIIAKPEEKWTNLATFHELYCAGHMAEAAVAMARGTGDEKFLNVSRRLMDLICKRYGPAPDQLKNIAGHPEIELALVKLYQYTGDEKYLNEAKFFVDCHGNPTDREKGLYGEYCQDHLPLREQSEPVGHAVRAMYLYSGATDVAGYFQDAELLEAMNRIWDNLTLHKMYFTGGIGSDASNEGFRGEFFLPNGSAYCETCAAIGLVFWAHRMNLTTGQARFADVMERALYNGVISGYGLSGDSYFYVNPLSSNGEHHREPFFGCACCPSNVIRMISSMPSYIYATEVSDETRTKGDGNGEPDTLVVNLFVEGAATIPLGGRVVHVTQKTGYPFDGKVSISLQVDGEEPFPINLKVRQPGKGEYRSESLTLSGKEPVERGFEFEMTPTRFLANPKVEADRGRVAIQRGPLVYCFEQCDNEVPVDEILLARDPKFTSEMKKGYIKSEKENDPTADFTCRDVVVVTAETADGKKVHAIPYSVWDNRSAGKMEVWIRQEGLTDSPDLDKELWKETDWTSADGKTILYRPLEDRFLTE